MKTRVYKFAQTNVYVAIVCTLMATLSHAFGQTWTPVNAPNTNWNIIASSADGSHLACTPVPGFPSSALIYTSTNSGATWTTCKVGNSTPGTACWINLCMSADGSVLVADSNNATLFVSTNSGSSWTASLTPESGRVLIGAFAVSGNGTHLAAAAANEFYASTNSGRTWTMSASPSASGLSSMACSADSHMLIAVYEFQYYLSTNFGTTWTNISSRMPNTETRAIGCASADGSTWVALADAGIIISTNSAATWSLNYYNGNPTLIKYVACSADGTKIIGSKNYSGGIYLSTNSGSTWGVFTNAGSTVYSVAASADGCQLAASGTNGIFLIQSTRPPTLNLTPSPASLTLSWIVPSTNFALQQSPDLISWTNVTNTPILNSDTLQYQVGLSVTGGNSFFRLASP